MVFLSVAAAALEPSIVMTVAGATGVFAGVILLRL